MNQSEIAKFLVETCKAKQLDNMFVLEWSNKEATRHQAVIIFVYDTYLIIESPIGAVGRFAHERVFDALAEEESPFGVSLGGGDLDHFVLRTMLPTENLNSKILNRATLLLGKNADKVEKRLSKGLDSY